MEGHFRRTECFLLWAGAGLWGEIVLLVKTLGELLSRVIHSEPPPLDHAAAEVLLLPYLVMHAHVSLGEFNFLPGSLATSPRTASQVVVLVLID